MTGGKHDRHVTATVSSPPLPPPTGPAVAGPPPAARQAGTDEPIYESTRRRVKLRITADTLSYGPTTMQASEITELAFWMPKPGHHRVHLEGGTTGLSFRLVGRGTGGLTARDEYVRVVAWLESRALPRLLQGRLARVGMGLTVRIGRLELREGGMRWRGRVRSSEVRWDAFDHVAVTRKYVTVMTRTGRGKLRPFARLPLNELNAVLLPMLVPAAATSFGPRTH